MKKELANYIVCLSKCLTQTNQANDRQLYMMYLADAAVILADLELGIEVNELMEKVETHNRLLVQTWIFDKNNYETFYEAWNKFRKLL